MKYSNVSLAHFLRFIEMFEAEALPMPGTGSELPIIHTYSRAQAIEDGTLIDVSRQARELDCLHPAAVTAGVWTEIVSAPVDEEWTEEINEDSRILALLDRALLETDEIASGEKTFKYSVRRSPVDDASRDVEVRAYMGPGEDDERVLTIMLVDED